MRISTMEKKIMGAQRKLREILEIRCSYTGKASSLSKCSRGQQAEHRCPAPKRPRESNGDLAIHPSIRRAPEWTRWWTGPPDVDARRAHPPMVASPGRGLSRSVATTASASLSRHLVMAGGIIGEPPLGRGTSDGAVLACQWRIGRRAPTRPPRCPVAPAG